MRLVLLLALVAALSSPAVAGPMETNQLVDGTGTPIGTSANPLYVSGGTGGGGGASGSVTAAGTNGTTAQAVQGIAGGVPQNSYTGQYNSTLPTMASGASGYLAVDANGRLIQSPGASVSVSNFPATQTVSQVPTSAFSVAKTTGIGTTATQVSATDTTNRRTVRNTGSIACEIMPGATAYGTGHPLPAGESFTFDASGRTTAALFVACASAGGTVSVISY